jgi:hypothetical protein
MKPASLVTLVVAPSLLLSAWACGGKEVTSTQTSSSTAGSTADPGTKKEASGDDGANAPAADGDAGPAPDCIHSNESGSGGGDGNGSYSCTTTHDYTCTSGNESITCDCTGTNGTWSPGSCSCNGLTFAFDCANGCSPGAAEYAKCGLPEPPPAPPGGGGGSSSSSGGN